MVITSRKFTVFGLCIGGVCGANNGVARTPPMGWRSWNFYACEVNQDVFERQIDALSDRSRQVDGKPTSLADLGYNHVGIDDCWQDCLTLKSYNGSYHTKEGAPIVDTSRFPDLKALSAKADAKGIKLGWYGNNCPETRGTGRGPKYCGEKSKLPDDWSPALHGDVNALITYGFSAVKLDGCGAGSNMQAYYDLVNATSPRPIVIENCHYNTTFPFWVDEPGGELACPMHFFRVSNDIKANWGSILANAHATIPYADATYPLSSPGCWAYPDMLEVGVTGQNGQSEGGLTLAEQRSHFGLWCVVSSPLTLSFDLGNTTLTDIVWPIIANTEALNVSQSWYGHPGSLTDQDKRNAGAAWQVWAKTQGPKQTAIMIINTGGATQSFVISLVQYGGVPKKVRDIWNQKDLDFDTAGGPLFRVSDLASHDSLFLLLSF